MGPEPEYGRTARRMRTNGKRETAKGVVDGGKLLEIVPFHLVGLTRWVTRWARSPWPAILGCGSALACLAAPRLVADNV